MYCPFCGSQNNDSNIYCLKCGKKLPAPVNNQAGVETSPGFHPETSVGTSTKNNWMIYAITFAVLILFMGIGGIYWAFNKKGNPIETANPTGTPPASTQTVISAAEVPAKETPNYQTTPSVAYDAELIHSLPENLSVISAENARNVNQLGRLGQGQIRDITFSPDSHSVIVLADYGFYIFDADSMRQQKYFETSDFYFLGVLSPKGDEIAYNGYEKGVFLADINTGRIKKTLNEQGREITAIAYSTDGNSLAVGLKNEDNIFIDLWGVSEGRLLNTIQGDSLLHTIDQIRFSQDDSWLAASSGDYSCDLVDIKNNKYWSGYNGSCLAFSPASKLLVTRSNTEITIGQVDNKDSQKATIPGNWASADFSLDFKLLSTSSWEMGKTKIWNTNNWSEVKTIQGVINTKFSPDGKRAFATTKDTNQVILMDTTNWNTLGKTSSFMDSISDFSISPIDPVIIFGTSDYLFYIWDFAKGEIIKTLFTNQDSSSNFSFSPDGSTFVSGGPDKIILWEANSWKRIRNLTNGINYFQKISISPDGKLIGILAGEYKAEKFHLIDVKSGREIRTLSNYVDDFAFSPDGTQIVTIENSENSHQINLWNIADGSIKKTYQSNNWVTSGVVVDISADGKYLVVGMGDRAIIYDINSSQIIRTLPFQSDHVHIIAFSPKTNILAVGTGKHIITLWDFVTGKQLRSLEGHKAYLTGMKFTSDGKILVTSSYDGSIRLWGIEQ